MWLEAKKLQTMLIERQYVVENLVTYIGEHHELFYEDYREIVPDYLDYAHVVVHRSIVFPK